MKWLYRLEYKFGRYYIRNLIPIMVGCMAAVYVADMALGGQVSPWLTFWSPLVQTGQVWRAITFLFVPPGGVNLGAATPAVSPFLVALSLYVTYIAGRMLENMWSGFRLNLYYLVGFMCALVGGFVSPFGLAVNTYLNSSLFLAVATLMPDAQFRLFMLIPIKGLWFAIAFLAFDVFEILRGFMTMPMLGFNALILFAFGLVNYAVFIGPTLLRTLREQARISRNRRNWRNRNR